MITKLRLTAYAIPGVYGASLHVFIRMITFRNFNLNDRVYVM